MRRIPPAFLAIILACVLVEAAIVLATLSGLPPARRLAFTLGGFWSPLLHGAPAIYPGQSLAMFATYGLLHSGLAHLAMNMLSLAALVREMAPALRTGRLLAIYAVSQVAGAALFALMVPRGGPMVGASGAVFGMAGALFGLALVRRSARGLPLGPLARSAGVLVGLNLLLTLMMPSVAWQAHVGGALAGFAMGLVYGRMR